MAQSTVHVYALSCDGAHLTDQTGPTLDAVSLQLPEGVYTTFRTYDHTRVLGASAHLQRLVDSHTLLGKRPRIDQSAIRSALREVIASEGLAAARLRITLPFDSDSAFICIEPFEDYPPEYYTLGVCCVSTNLRRETPEAKYTSFIYPSRALKASVEASIHEVLMVDGSRQILEGISSNFFAVLDGKLHTAGEGVLLGVTRSVVLAEAQGLIVVNYTPVNMSNLLRLTEAFLTSSSRAVMPIIQIDECIIGTGQPGSITKSLIARYHNHCLQASEWI